MANCGNSRHVYGPVPSRRLGRSLGIDLVPYKTCTYDCVYCHLGPTTHKTVKRKEYVEIRKVLGELQRKLAGPVAPDYISLAGSGEPTLNSGIGDLIAGIKGMTKIPVAVLTNGALLWLDEVQEALRQADLVLPSLDVGDERMFRHINRPHPDLDFAQVVDGLASFTRRFRGEVWLEVLLLAGSTGTPVEVGKIAELVGRIGAARVQLNTAFRPPAEGFAVPLSPGEISALRGIFPGRVEIICENDASARPFDTDGQVGHAEVLELLKRRPCTSIDVANGLGIHATEAVKHLDALLRSGQVTAVRKDQRTFFTVVDQLRAPGPKGGR